MTDSDLHKLADPFPPGDIEWRVQSCGAKADKSVWAKVLAYVTNRAIMNRLDSVCGPGNWRNEYRDWPGNSEVVLCGISVRVGDEWVTKWDGAEQTDIEAAKGGFSNAMKRAAVQWGIGRYLYDLEEGWAVISPNGKHYAKTKDNVSFRWDAPNLPPWALPREAPKNGQPKAEKKPETKPGQSAACAAMTAAKSLDDLSAFWKSLPDKDRRHAELIGAKDRRKLELTRDAIEELVIRLKFDSLKLSLLEESVGVTDPLSMTVEQATKLYDALKAELASLVPA